MPGQSDLEATLLFQLRAMRLPTPETQHRFHPSRRWRFDFAWPDEKLAVEVDGGTWVGGRHVRGLGYARDVEKMNAATLAGWRVLRFTSEQVHSGAALDTVAEALGRAVLQMTPGTLHQVRRPLTIVPGVETFCGRRGMTAPPSSASRVCRQCERARKEDE